VNEPNPLYERFNQLLRQIHLEIDQLKKKNQSLIEENERLKAKLENAGSQPEDVFAKLGEPEKIALRHQIDGLIAKIDQHLEA
jgi:regulator of replication initiation timing